MRRFVEGIDRAQNKTVMAPDSSGGRLAQLAPHPGAGTLIAGESDPKEHPCEIGLLFLLSQR